MTTLVVAEHDNAALKPSTLNTVGAAAKIGQVLWPNFEGCTFGFRHVILLIVRMLRRLQGFATSRRNYHP